jgi:hypothetical protein
MRRFSKREVLHAIACLTGAVFLWIDSMTSARQNSVVVASQIQYSRWPAIGSLLYLLALLLMFFRRRAAATIALTATLL